MSEIEELSARVARLEAWVEVVMQTLALLGLETSCSSFTRHAAPTTTRKRKRTNG